MSQIWPAIQMLDRTAVSLHLSFLMLQAQVWLCIPLEEHCKPLTLRYSGLLMFN